MILKTVLWLFYGIKSTLLPIHYLLEGIADVCDGIYKSLTSISFERIARSILMIAASIALLASIEPHALINALAVIVIIVGVVVGIMFALTKMVDAVKIIQRRSKTLGKAIRGIFDQFRENLQAMQNFQKIRTITNAIASIANSLIKASIAILILSKIPKEDIFRSLTSALAILGFMAGLIIYFNKTSSSMKQARTMKKTINSLNGLVVLLLGIAISLKILGNLSWTSLLSATLAITAVLAALVGAVVLMSKFVSMKSIVVFSSFSKALIPFTVALLLLSSVIALLSTIKPGKLWGSLAAILVFTTVIILVSNLANTMGAIRFAIFNTSLILFGAAMQIMAGVLLTMSLIPTNRVKDGMKAITGFIALAALSIKLIGWLSAIKFGIFSRHLIKFASAMVIMSTCIVAIGTLEPEQSERGRKTITKLLTLVALSIKLIGWLSAVKFGVLSTSLILFGNAMLILSGVIAILGSMDSGAMWRGIGGILAFTSGIVLLSSLLIDGRAIYSLIGLSIGMLALTAAIIPFTTAILMLGNINLKTLAIGILALAASLGVLGLLSIALKPCITTMIALSAVLLLAGVGMLSAGVGLTMLATGLDAIAVAFVAQFEAIKVILLELSSLILEILFNAILLVIERLNDIMPAAFDLISNIIDAVVTLLFEKGPAIIELLVTMLDNVLKTINEKMSSIADSIFGILKTILVKLAENIDELGQSLIDVIIGLIKTLTKNMQPLMKAVINLLIEFTIALFNNIDPLVKTVTDYIFDFLGKVIVLLTGKIVALAGLVAKVVLILLAAVIRITIASLGALSKLFLAFVAGILLILLYTFTGLTDVLFEIFKVAISETLRVLYKVVVWAIPATIKIFKVMVQAVISGILRLIAEMVSDIPLIGDWLEGKISGLADKIDARANETIDNLSDGIEGVESALQNAGNNIGKAVTMTSDMATAAVSDGIGQISSAVTDSMDMLGDSLSEFGEQAGNNLYQGLGSSDNINGANQVGQEMGNATAEGFSEATETHSPSRLFARFGNFLMQGLGLGIQNGASETENAMAEVISESLQLATDILDGQENDDYTIKVGMDISSVEAQTSRIQDIMSGVNDPSITASGRNAGYNARALDRNNSKGSETVNNDNSTTVTYNNTFNIESTDPQQSADEIDRVLKEQNTRYKLAHGT